MARWHSNHINLTALVNIGGMGGHSSQQVAESAEMRLELEVARREVAGLRRRCVELEEVGCARLEIERGEGEGRGEKRVTGENSEEIETGQRSDGQSDVKGEVQERRGTPQPDYPDASTLEERDVAREETVMVQALTVSLDSFRQRYTQHPPPVRHQHSPAHDHNTNKQLKKANARFTKSAKPTKPYNQKTERKLPKTPDPPRHKLLNWSSEQHERIVDVSPQNMRVTEFSDEEPRTQHYNTMDTMSTRSFGFSRPLGTWVHRERERRQQLRSQFLLQETSLGGQKMVHYRRPGGRARSEDSRTSLARSKSMDMVARASRLEDSKRRVVRASSVSRVGEEEDWRESTPFLSPRRGGRRGDRTSWGLDQQGPIFDMASTTPRSGPALKTVNSSLYLPGRKGSSVGRQSPPPPIPTPDYPDLS